MPYELHDAFEGSLLRSLLMGFLEIHDTLKHLLKGQNTLMGKVEQLILDEKALNEATSNLADSVGKVIAFRTAQEALIADQTAEIALLKSTNPDLDLTTLEANLVSIQQLNLQLASIIPAPPTPVVLAEEQPAVA